MGSPYVLPEWHALRAARSSANHPKRVVCVLLSIPERDEFYRRAYGGGTTPSAVLRQFIGAYLAGAPIPSVSVLRRHEYPTLTTQVSVALPLAAHARLVEQVKADGQKAITPVLRRFVLAYIRDDHVALGSSPQAPSNP